MNRIEASKVKQIVEQATLQGRTIYKPGRWIETFDGVLPKGVVASALTDPELSLPEGDEQWSVDRPKLRWAAQEMNLEDSDQVLKVFLLLLAWGNGTKSRWGFYNARKAIAGDPEAVAKLTATARALREADTLAQLRDEHQSWSLKHINEAFFTKWFAFAGYMPGRSWQPLILDENVRNTLRDTLCAPLSTLTHSVQPSDRYVAYVFEVHELSESALLRGISPEAIEYALFWKDGAPLGLDA